MPLIALLTVFISSLIFYPHKIISEEAQPPLTKREAGESAPLLDSLGLFPKTDNHTQSLMDFLNKSFQIDSEEIKQHDKLLVFTLSDMKNCLYTRSIVAQVMEIALDRCDQLIKKARGESNISSFLLRKAIAEGDFKEKREQALTKALQETKDLIFHCQCYETSDQDFIIREKYDTSREEIAQMAQLECLKKPPKETQRNIVCKPRQETDEQTQDEMIENLRTELEYCTDDPGGIDSFPCQALIKEAKEADLSYFQIRYAIQKRD